jgi:hypothetical protein
VKSYSAGSANALGGSFSRAVLAVRGGADGRPCTPSVSAGIALDRDTDDIEAMLACMDEAAESRSFVMGSYFFSPKFHPFRSDLRFQEILQKMKPVAQWLGWTCRIRAPTIEVAVAADAWPPRAPRAAPSPSNP